MNATERTHLVTESAVAEHDDAEPSSASRRSLLGSGLVGAGVLGAALAVNAGRASAAAPGTLSAADRNLMGFAIELETAARDLYQAAIDAGRESTGWQILRSQHGSYAERLAGLAGISADSRNSAVYDEMVGGFSGDSPANAAFTLENVAAATHLELLGLLEDKDLADAIASIASMESRHAAYFAERSGRGDNFDALFTNTATAVLPEATS